MESQDGSKDEGNNRRKHAGLMRIIGSMKELLMSEEGGSFPSQAKIIDLLVSRRGSAEGISQRNLEKRFLPKQPSSWQTLEGKVSKSPQLLLTRRTCGALPRSMWLNLFRRQHNAGFRETHMDSANIVSSERLLPLSEVMRRTGKGRSSIYAAIRRTPPRFPRPVKDGISTRWVESEIDSYIRLRISERDAKASSL